MNFEDLLKTKDEAKKAIFQLLAMEKEIEWDIESIVPNSIEKNDVLSKIYGAFKKETNIPTALPIFSFFGYLSAFLLKQGITIDVPGVKSDMLPDVWIINLADSGASKTFSKSLIESMIPVDENNKKIVQANIEQCSSSAAFIQEISDKNNGFYFQDECAQILKQIEVLNSPVSEMKKYLLMTYDHQPISRKTKKDEIRVESPALTILWLNTIDSFVKNISPESIYDGFCQRFMYVMSLKDVDRLVGDFPVYPAEKIKQSVSADVHRMFNQNFHSKYTVDNEAMTRFKVGFKEIYETHFNSGIDESFYRRVMFNAFKYALFYHVILEKDSDQIDKDDMWFALRVCMLHLNSLKKLLTYKKDGYNSEIEQVEKIILKAKKIKKEFKEKGKELTARELQRKIAAIKTADQAHEVLSNI